MEQPLKLKDARPTFLELLASVAVVGIDGEIAIDGASLLEHEGNCGSNGGRGCDVIDGPCSCGAWH